MKFTSHKPHLTFLAATLLLCSTSGFLQAQTCVQFPGFPVPSPIIPFSSVYSITGANGNGDRLVVGVTSLTFLSILQTQIPLPAFVNQRYCQPVEIAPGLFVDAYVPTAAERQGDFSPFSGLLIDPLTGGPFPGGILPASRAPDPYAWRIRSVAAPAINHTVSSVPLNAVQTGIAELLGQVSLTKAAPNGATQTTSASVISFLYQGAAVANPFSGSISMNMATGVIQAPSGIAISVTGGWRNPGVSATVGAGGGQIDLSIPAGLAIRDGDTITVQGVRANLTRAPGVVNVSVASSPGTAHTFGNSSQIQVARASAGLSVTASGVSVKGCEGSAPIVPTVTIAEGFTEAFVQHTPAPAGARPAYGANGNTQVRVVVGNLLTGVSVSWPVVVRLGAANLTRVNQSANGAEVLYDFSTANQAVSDQNQEMFQIIPSVTVSSGATLGQRTIQAQLYPEAFGTNVPRFDDPLQPVPAANFISLTACEEKIPPNVTMTVPAEGSTVSGVIEVAAEATDNVGVVGVQFLVDGVVIGVEDRAAPYSILFDTSLMSLGRHEFTARARDASNNQATAAAVTVTKVGNPNISDLNPSSKFEGDLSFPLTVFGSNFTQKSVVLWDQSPRVTQFISSTQIVAKIPTNDIVNPRTYSVSVRDGNVTSDSRSFIVHVNNEPPVLTGVLPPFISIEGNTRIRLLGRNFKASMVGNTQFLIGGKLVTGLTFVNSSEVDAIAPPNPEGLSEVVMILPAGLEGRYSHRLVSSQTSSVGLEHRANPEVPSTPKPGYTRQRIPFVIDTEHFRTNLGINNLGSTEAAVEILMSDSNGKLVFRRKTVKVPARGMTQCNRVIQLAEKAENESSTELDCTLGELSSTGREGYLLLESEQPFVAWASQIDKFTFDASMEQGLPESAAASKLVLPSSVGNSQFRTSLIVVNHSASQGQVQIRSRKADDGTAQVSVTRTLERYGYLFFEDFYKEAGGSDGSDVFGPIELETTGGINIAAAARIYTQQGTSGYFEGVALGRASQNVLLPYSLDNLDFRTNLGITNPGESVAHVTVKLVSRSGQLQGIYPATVAPHGMTQIDNINRKLLNIETISNLDGYLLVESDQSVFGWTSQIDNWSYDVSMVVGKSGTAGSSLLIPSTTNSGEYKSTLALVNPGATSASVQLTARDQYGNITGTSQPFVVDAQGMIVDTDIRKKLGSDESFGPLELIGPANHPLLAVSRVYSTQRTGGYFEGIPIGP